MQKWEYCGASIYHQTLTFFTPNGPKEEKIKREKAKGDRSDWDAIHRRIAEIGLEGWELVGMFGGAPHYTYYFKRPLPEIEESEG